ncbi:MAG: MFS transporter [Ruminococcaceae bacterium]|nr:MFS transporter [Oscillospiraceae bacterium]
MIKGSCREKQSDTGGFLIFLCWLVYSVSYLGKVNYSANITQIIDFYGVTKAEAGIAPTLFFFAYGIGQVVNGLLCKKYNIKWMIFFGLSSSAVINFIIATTKSFTLIKWLWMINGFALSVLWPTLIRNISEKLPKKHLTKSSIAMGTTVATGTLVIYALSSVYAHFNHFKLAFYTPAFSGLAVSLFWLASYSKTKNLKRDDLPEETSEKTSESLGEEEREHQKSEKQTLYLMICVLCFCAIGVNLIKDGLTTWVPSILKDEYKMSDSISILLTVFLPVVAVFGNLFSLKVHKRIPDYIIHCGIIFMVVFTFVGVIIGSIRIKQVIIMLICLVTVNFLASSLNSLITSIFPIFMRGKLNSGLFAGILNGFCYVGSALSSFALGSIADGFGWETVFWCLLGFCGLIIIVCLGYIPLKYYLGYRKK